MVAILNKDENFRNRLIEMVKASGQEVIDRAEDLVVYTRKERKWL